MRHPDGEGTRGVREPHRGPVRDYECGGPSTAGSRRIPQDGGDGDGDNFGGPSEGDGNI